MIQHFFLGRGALAGLCPSAASWRSAVAMLLPAGKRQGCQIFLCTIFQSGEKIYQMTTKLPNAHNKYPMVVK
jgi:hypothetical protein